MRDLVFEINELNHLFHLRDDRQPFLLEVRGGKECVKH